MTNYSPTTYVIEISARMGKDINHTHGITIDTIAAAEKIMVRCSDGNTRLLKNRGKPSKAEKYIPPNKQPATIPPLWQPTKSSSEDPSQEEINNALAKIKNLMYNEPEKEVVKKTCIDWFLPHAL